MHICVSKLTIIGSDNGLLPGQSQAIIWTNAGMLLIRTLGTNLSEVSSENHTFSFKKMHLNMLCVKWRQFCLSLNVLMKPGARAYLISSLAIIIQIWWKQTVALYQFESIRFQQIFAHAITC